MRSLIGHNAGLLTTKNIVATRYVGEGSHLGLELTVPSPRGLQSKHDNPDASGLQSNLPVPKKIRLVSGQSCHIPST